MAIQETSTATVTPVRPRLFDPHAFRYTFMRALWSELRKLTASVGFWLTGAAAVLLAFGLGVLMPELLELIDGGATQKFDPALVTMVWDSYGLFLIPLAVVAVSSEYAHNTMRATVLSVPSRPTAFAAKMTAIFIYCGTLAFVILLANFTSVLLFSDTTGFAPHSLRALVVCWVVLTSLALGSAGLAYLMRSTALPIVVIVVILEFSSLASFIPNDTVRDFLYNFLPTYVGHSAMQTGSHSLVGLMIGIDNDHTWASALALWFGYMAALIGGGFARFMKSDV